MIWALIAIRFMQSNNKHYKVLSEDITLEPLITNVLVIASLSMVMNFIIVNQRISKRQKSILTIVVIIGICVIAMIVSDRALKYLIIIELTVIPIRFLIINTAKEKDKVESIKFIVIINTAGSVPFMIFVSITWRTTYTIIKINYSLRSLTTFLIIFLFLVKTPLFLTHMWLTKVHVSASGNCSIILASIIIKIGTMGLFKFVAPIKRIRSINALLSICMVGSFYLNIIILRYYDSKTIIAISSVLHIAIIIPMILLRKRTRIISSIIIMTAHGIISYILFFLITIKYEGSQNRSSIIIKSDERKRKIIAAIIITLLFINIGLPPILNFLSESIFLLRLRLINRKISLIIIIINLLITVIFTIQISSRILYGKRGERLIKRKIRERTAVKVLILTLWSVLIIMTI